ncbi:Hypothetical protein ETEE_3800 [Edwardsiella anguillarum ET080813]|uniref:Uncharacterized protein n=1 Tax=Edwardsiella anguillarum ET080813 TaxID=667120 RepID=A0A076LU37_9GAMM|nr:Hypothetical protein ETEE_3800 [Edwardsiella anguillarum ET080813]
MAWTAYPSAISLTEKGMRLCDTVTVHRIISALDMYRKG